MRLVIQRVSRASVSSSGFETASVGKGMLILAGIEESDTIEDAEWLAGKVTRLRIFADTMGVMNHSVCEIGGSILVVSQFTLHASTRKGNRPSYIRAARPETAVPLFESFVRFLKETTGLRVETGWFGAMMQVELVNDGPVTIIMDSKIRE
ncbi:MAG TPA: D-aminoacyl-tRNA deacylase [Lentimicrobium sp.]|jgi:D-tyrosyl-tRNA(Tyr) deacylase|nr:D-aminoacyl-tRNA deacylase [Lentimicrobium sp.]